MATIIKKQKRHINKNLQIILILIHIAIIFFLISFPARFYYSKDPFLSLQEEYRYKNKISNIKNTSINFFIQDFLDADMNKGSAKIDIIMKTTYNKKYVDPSDFTKISSIYGYIKHMMKVNSKELENDLVEDTWKILFVGSFDLNYSLFPFNDHVLNFAFLFPKTVFPIIHSGAISHSSLDDINGWKIIKSDSFFEEETELGKKVWCSIAMSKTGYRQATAIILPLYLLLLISLFSLSFDSSKAYSAILSVILAMNAFRVFLENATPKTSYFVMSDEIFLIFLIIAFLILMIHLFSQTIHIYFRYAFLISIHIGIILFFAYQLRPWIIFGT